MWSALTWDLVTTERWAGDGATDHCTGERNLGALEQLSVVREQVSSVTRGSQWSTFHRGLKERKWTFRKRVSTFSLQKTRPNHGSGCYFNEIKLLMNAFLRLYFFMLASGNLLEERSLTSRESLGGSRGNHERRQKQSAERPAAVSATSSAVSWPAVIAAREKWYAAQLWVSWVRGETDGELWYVSLRVTQSVWYLEKPSLLSR